MAALVRASTLKRRKIIMRAAQVLQLLAVLRRYRLGSAPTITINKGIHNSLGDGSLSVLNACKYRRCWEYARLESMY